MWRIILCVLVVVAAADTARFWHVSDTHQLFAFREGSNPKQQCVKGEGNVKKFGHHSCDAPPAILNAVWERLSHPEDKADFVLWTGDHMSIFEPVVGMDSVRAAVKNVTASLLQVRKASGSRVYPILGNHDSSPMFQFPSEGPFYVYTLAAEEWALLPDISKESLASIKHALWYTEMLRPKLRLICLNTLMYYMMNMLVDHYKPDPSGQLVWLRKTLQECRRNGEYVYIATHIPPGFDECAGASHMWKIFNDGMIDVLEEFSDVITASFYGHLHHDSFRLVRGKNATTVSFLTSGTSTRGINPSITMYEYNTEPPFTITDRTNYYIDIDLANKQGFVQWDVAYRATQFYQIKDMSAASLDGFVKRMTVDEAMFERFWVSMKGTYSDDGSRCDTKACRLRTLCYMTFGRAADVNACIAGYRSV